MIRAHHPGSCENCGNRYTAGVRLSWRMVDMGTPRQRFQFCLSPCWDTSTTPPGSDDAR